MTYCNDCGMPVNKDERDEDDKDCEIRLCADGKAYCTTCYLHSLLSGNLEVDRFNVNLDSNENCITYTKESGEVLGEIKWNIKDTNWSKFDLLTEGGK
tara:strand:+ start:156 stop:449 length:294 start_codon:yes stop_codon:yes gene_type:complete